MSFDARTDAGAMDVVDAGSIVFDYPGFATCPGDITLVGSAACSAGAIEITPDAASVVGAMWLPYRLPTSRSLSLEVTITIQSSLFPTEPADGLALVFHDDPRGIGALGQGGLYLGYDAITPSAALELDIFPNPPDEIATRHLALDTGGMVLDDDAPEVSVTFDMTTGTPFRAWFDYDAVTKTLSASAASSVTKPSTPQITRAYDLGSIGTEVWVGATGATGFNTALQRVLAIRVVVQ